MMSRKEIKAQAIKNLRGNYGIVLFGLLILALFGGICILTAKVLVNLKSLLLQSQ